MLHLEDTLKELSQLLVSLLSWNNYREEVFYEMINNLHSTENWEPSEQSKSSSNQTNLCLESDFLIILHNVEGWRVEVDLEQLKLSKLPSRNWKFNKGG